MHRVILVVVALSVGMLGHATTHATMPVTAASPAQSGTVSSVTYIQTPAGRPDTITIVNGTDFDIEYAVGFDGRPSTPTAAGEYDGTLTGHDAGAPSDTWFTYAYATYDVCFFTGGVDSECGASLGFVAYAGRSYVVTLYGQGD